MNNRLSQTLGELLLRRGWTLSLAESCTGGGVAQAVTAVSGSSQWFNYGLVTYSNEAKTQLLNVPEALLVQHGAVNEAVAEAMAVGAQDLARSDIAIAITGIAGPEGGSSDKPVGTVCFAWNVHGQVVSERCRFNGNRDSVREQAIICAINGAIKRIESTV